MVIVTKKNDKPCRTIDLQKLNAQCCQETLSVTLHLACQIHPNTKKDYSKGANEFHAIEIGEASHKATAFISEWGRYCCYCLP